MDKFKMLCGKIWDNKIGKIAIIILVLCMIFYVINGLIGIIKCNEISSKYKKFKDYLIKEKYSCTKDEATNKTICINDESDTKTFTFSDDTCSNLFTDGIKKNYVFEITFSEKHWYGNIEISTDAYSNKKIDEKAKVTRKNGYQVFAPTSCKDDESECILNIGDTLYAPYSKEYDQYSSDVNNFVREFERLFSEAKIKLK